MKGSILYGVSCCLFLMLSYIILASGCVGAVPSLPHNTDKSPNTAEQPTIMLKATVAMPARGGERKTEDTPLPILPLTPGPGEATRQPTPTLAPLFLGDEPIQGWSNPNEVNGLLHDGQYLWAATDGGVVRWSESGESRVYTLKDGLASLAIRGIAQDGEGHIWVGYADHPAWSEYRGDKWYSYASREQAVTSRYQAMLSALHWDPRLWSRRDHSVWIWLPSSDGRVAAYDGHKWRTYGQAEGVTQSVVLVAVTANGRIWAVGEGVSTAKEGDTKWETYCLPGEAPDKSVVTDLAVDKQGRAWLAFASSHPQSVGVSYLDPACKCWTSYAHALDSDLPKQVYCLEFQEDDAIYLCSDEGIVISRPGMRWERLSFGLAIQSLLRDQRGRLWLGTSQGIYAASADGRELLGPWSVHTSIISNKINSLVMDSRGTLWLGTSKGLAYVKAYGEAGVVLGNEEILCLTNGAKGDLWAGSTDGLYNVQNDGSYRQLLHQGASEMALNTQGRLWICTLDGQIGLMDGTGWHPKARLHEFALPLRSMLIQADGSVWLGTAQGLGNLTPDGSFVWAEPAERLREEDIHALALDPTGVLWIGTANGLLRRWPDGRLVRLTPHSTGGGLRSKEIRDLRLTTDGQLWIATSAGISLRTPEGSWFYYDLPGARTLWPESSQVLWVGTQGGLYRLKRELLNAVP